MIIKRKRIIAATATLMFCIVASSCGNSKILINDNAKSSEWSGQNEGENINKNDEAEQNRIQDQYGDLSSTQIGDTISFGNYEGNCEWIVLDKMDGKLLLLSKYVFERRICMTTWEDSALREWLNNYYYNVTFDSVEKARIVSTLVKNEDNLKYGAPGGEDTVDKVFLLSSDEAYYYFNTDDERKATTMKNEEVCWSLRSPGDGTYSTTYVEYDGQVNEIGNGGVKLPFQYVRPAMWISEQCSTEAIERIEQSKVELAEEIGNTITFGNYKGNTEWIVLDKQENKMLILSKYVIEIRPDKTEEEEGAIIWETCKMREWLNKDYLEETFNEQERASILQTEINNEGNQYYLIEGGNDTEDKVFLLSIEEAEKYLPSYEKRKTTLIDGTEAGWWLRSPSSYRIMLSRVDYDGIVYIGMPRGKQCGVRPAMWITIN